MVSVWFDCGGGIFGYSFGYCGGRGYFLVDVMSNVVGMDGKPVDTPGDELPRVRECVCGCVDYHLWGDGTISCAECAKSPNEANWVETEIMITED